MTGYGIITAPRLYSATDLISGRADSRRSVSGDRLRLAVSYVEGRRHPPIIELRRAA